MLEDETTPVDSDGFADAFAEAFFGLGKSPEQVKLERLLDTLKAGDDGATAFDGGHDALESAGPIGGKTLYGSEPEDSDVDLADWDPIDLGDGDAIL